MTRTRLFIVIGALLAATPARAPRAQQPPTLPPPDAVVSLVPTNHPRLPADLSQLWLAPAKGHARTAAMKQFADAVKFEVDANYAKALPIFSQPSQQQGPLGHYAAFYAGLAQLRLGQAAEARDTFRALLAHEPVGYLAEAAAVKEAESDEALGDRAAAIEIYERLSKMKTTAPDDVLMRLAKTARAAGDVEKASTAFARVYYEFPLSDLSPLASAELESLPNVQPIAPGNARYKLEFGRAERLFGSKRYAQARTAFEGLNQAAQGGEREIVNLRLAECDYFLKRPRNTRDEARPYIEHASRQAEALFFYAIATRDLGDHAEYLTTIRRIVDEFPTQSWAEEALNNLATHYILQSEDDQAEATFRELYDKYPTGRYAERAAWKIGWAAYRTGRYAETTRVFEKAAFDFPRSDFRPPWLYWSGRAHEALKEPALAEARYRLAATDYLNSYYGRLAVKHLDAAPHRRLVVDTSASSHDDGELVPAALPPNSRSCARCSAWSCTTRRLTSCTTRRECGATRRRFRRPSAGFTTSAGICGPASTR